MFFTLENYKGRLFGCASKTPTHAQLLNSCCTENESIFGATTVQKKSLKKSENAEIPHFLEYNGVESESVRTQYDDQINKSQGG